MHLNDLDPLFIKCISHLHSSDNLMKGEPVPLQLFLEEAIKNKSGITKDLTNIVSVSFKQRKLEEYRPLINVTEETKASSSDNELELDLFKEDLMCVVCNEMDVGAGNRLLECSDCHALYHQECHKPIVTIQDSFETWICQDCKDANKNLKIGLPTSTSPVMITKIPAKPTSSSSSSSSSSSYRHTSTNPSGTYKISSSSMIKVDKYSKSSSKSTASSSSSKLSSGTTTTAPAPTTSTAVSSTTSRSNITPNINIISADKRIQIMKKKAAKLQEKRKHSTR